MAWWERRSRPAETRGVSDWYALLESTEGAALESVGTDQALRVSAVQACVRVLSDALAGLPLHLYRHVEGGKKFGKKVGKERADDLPVARALRAPSGRMSAYDLRRVLAVNRLLQGNGYGWLIYDASGRLLEIQPVEAWRVQVFRTDNGLLYRWHDETMMAHEVTSPRMLHFRGLSGNGLVGFGVIGALMQDQAALAYSMQKSARQFIANGSRLSGVLTVREQLKKDAIDKLRAAWNAVYGGSANAGKTAVLDAGAEYKAISVSPVEAQFLEQRKFSVEDIARCFGVPPHLIGVTGQSSYGSAEQNALEFVQYTLLPLAKSFEATLNATLLTEGEREKFFFEHSLDGLLRGDAKSRNEAYAIGVQNGWLSRNEVRGLENLNPVDGLDEYLAPLNMTTAPALAAEAENVLNPPEPTPQNAPPPQPSVPDAPTPAARAFGRQWTGAELRGLVDVGDLDADLPVHEHRADDGEPWEDPLTDDQRGVMTDRQGIAAGVVELWTDAAGRLVRREVADIKRKLAAGTMSQDELREWLTGFYAELQPKVPSYFGPALRTSVRLAAQSVARELGKTPAASELEAYMDEYLRSLAAAWAASGAGQLMALNDAADEPGVAVEAIQTRVGEWEEKRADKVGNRQAFNSVNGGSLAAMAIVGVTAVYWLARGTSCPHCRSLSGKRVAIGSSFTGDRLTAGGKTMEVYGIKKHAPLHGGCDCTVGAG